MTRLCIIGNSHAACWLTAWRENRTLYAEQADIDFFMLGGYDIDLLEKDNLRLIAPRDDLRTQLQATSEKSDHIDTAKYDHFLIISLTFGYRNLTQLFSQFGLADDPYQPDDLHLLSKACLEESINSILEDSLAVRLRKKLAAITSKPVILSPAPCQSEAVLLTKDQHFAALCQHGQQTYLYDYFCRQATKLGGQHHFDIAFQSPDTLINGKCYTRKEHNRGGLNSSLKTVGETDTSHMNAAFGKLELDNALVRIQQNN